MGIERRKDIRLVRRFDGSWSGASGGSSCRVTDVSASGCFVHSLAVPQIGERTLVTIDCGPAGLMTLEADVVYVERAMGFGLRFSSLDTESGAEFRRLLDAHKQASPPLSE